MKALALFCGMGGATEGMVRAGLDVRAAVDGWQTACHAHVRWHPTIPTICARVESSLPNDNYDFIWASPSCKPWSTANRTPKRGLAHPEYYPLARLVEQAFGAWRARWLVIENVGGLIWSREGREEMARLDAACRSWRWPYAVSVVPANSLGIAQIRRRVFIVVGPCAVRVRPGDRWVPVREPPPQLFPADGRGGFPRKTIGPRAGLSVTGPFGYSTDPRTGVVNAVGPRAERCAPTIMACEGSKGSWAQPFASTAVSVDGRDAGRGTRNGETVLVAPAVFSTPHPGGAHRAWRDEASTILTKSRHKERKLANGFVSARLPSRDGVQHPDADEARFLRRLPGSIARTISECCDLQHVPLGSLSGIGKTAAFALVGNAVPPPMAEHVCRTVMRADAEMRR